MKKKYFIALATIALSATLSTNAMKQKAEEKSTTSSELVSSSPKEALLQLQTSYSSKEITANEVILGLIKLINNSDLSKIDFSENEITTFTDFVSKIYILSTNSYETNFLDRFEEYLDQIYQEKKPFEKLMEKQYHKKISPGKKLCRLFRCCCCRNCCLIDGEDTN